MKSLFILQLVCCVITAMLALQLARASLQVRWKVGRYEISRWILEMCIRDSGNGTHVPCLLHCTEHDLVITVRISQQLVMVQLHDERNLMGVLTVSYTQLEDTHRRRTAL